MIATVAYGRRRSNWRRQSAGTTGRWRCRPSCRRHCRRVILVAAVMDGVVDWPVAGIPDEDAEPIGLMTYLLLKRVDDLAYGLGLVAGVVRERNSGAQTADPD